MNSYFKIVFITFCLAISFSALSSAAFAQGKKLQWKGIRSKTGDFTFAIPEGFETFDDGEFSVGTIKHPVRVSSRTTVLRYVNGVVLSVQIYEGKALEIDAGTSESLLPNLIREGTVNTFKFKSYLIKYPEYIHEQQRFVSDKTMYIVSAVYRKERGEITDKFFKSIRLVKPERVIAPNFSKDTLKKDLSEPLPEISVEALNSEEPVDQPDKKPVILYRPRPDFNMEFGRSNSGTVKLKVLLSASGKVSDIKMISTPNVSLLRGVRPSAEHVYFLPAEKNGKSVASWEIIEYGFKITVNGF